jgi:hypothetical protein
VGPGVTSFHVLQRSLYLSRQSRGPGVRGSSCCKFLRFAAHWTCRCTAWSLPRWHWPRLQRRERGKISHQMRSGSSAGAVYTFRRIPSSAVGNVLRPSGRGFWNITTTICQQVVSRDQADRWRQNGASLNPTSPIFFEKRIFLWARFPPRREAGDVGIWRGRSPRPPLELVIADFFLTAATNSVRTIGKKKKESFCTRDSHLVVRLATSGFGEGALWGLLSNLSSPDFWLRQLPIPMH